MIVSPALLVLATLLGSDSLPRVTWHDNLQPAGTRTPGRMSLALEIRRGDWHPNGDARAGTTVLAFAERGKGPTTPGPLLRVRAGTRIDITLTNTTSDTIAVHGLGSRQGTAVFDSLMVLPGETCATTFVADVEGTYFYWGARPGTTLATRAFDDALLSGALIVDPATGPVLRDRVLVIDVLLEKLVQDGALAEAGGILVINGRPWPRTERLQHTVGDSVHWRVINASPRPHPMHLHGFYFRLDAAGDWQRDTLYDPRQRRMAVTENILSGTTRLLTWSPDRPGGWLFHCHLSFHALMNDPLGGEWRGGEAAFMHAVFGATNAGAANHVENHMGGLIMLVQVAPRGPLLPAPPPARTVRLLVTATPDTLVFTRQYQYHLDDGTTRDLTPAASPSPVLVLQRGEPTAVTIVNATPEATTVHWHGIEIDAYSDGVVGVGGHAHLPTPPIMPGDSFVARITAPRSGSFMYHTHITDINQMGKGLAGPLLVVEDRHSHDPRKERVLLAQNQLMPDGLLVLLNRSAVPAPDTVQAGEAYRLRFMNITLGNPGLVFQFSADSIGALWTTIAKDGFDLPRWQRRTAPAQLAVSIGETMDVTWRPRPGGSGWIELRAANGDLFVRQRIEVMPPVRR